MAWRTSIFAMLLLTPGLGCRLFNVASPSDDPTLSGDVLDALSLQLRRDAWQINPRRSLLKTTANGRLLEAESARDYWRFATPVVRKFVAPSNAPATVNAMANDSRSRIDSMNREDVPWSGWTATTPAETLAESGIDSRYEGLRYLAALVEQDGLVGWNAAILYAQRDPATAHRLAPILERLVVDPPYYDPQSGRQVSPPRNHHRSTGASAKRNTTTARGDESRAVAGSDGVKQELLSKSREEAAARDLKKRPSVPPKGDLWNRMKALVSSEARSNRSQQISPAMQSAAAEAWCRVLAKDPASSRRAYFPAGRLLKRFDLPDVVRAELFRGIARRVPPSEIPRLENAMREGAFVADAVEAIVRRAAIEACLIHAMSLRDSAPAVRTRTQVDADIVFDASLWPETVVNCRHDPDPQVRATYGRWVVLSGHPDAIDVLDQQFVDPDAQVRLGSMLSLGMTQTRHARRRLRGRAERGEDNQRAMAVRSLAFWGIAELERYANDAAEPVQHAVATSLAEFPSVRAGRILQRYYPIASDRVQAAGLDSIAGWPDALALPVLLHAMGHGSKRTARVAFRDLRDRQRRQGVTPPASFPSLDVQPVRAKAAEQIAYRYDLPLDWGRTGIRHEADEPHINKRYVRELEMQLAILAAKDIGNSHRAAIERLHRVPDDDVALIERLVLKSRDRYPEVLFLEVLAEKSPSYAALKDLYDDDPLVQRRGAHRLANLGSQRPLSSLVVRLMHDRLRDRRDRVLWASAMRAIMPDATEECEQFATESAFHVAPTVRAYACEYFTRHPNPLKADILLQLMNDRHDRNVRLAAIRAAGYSRSPELISGRRAVPIPSKPGVSKPPKKKSVTRDQPRDLLGLKDLMISSDATVRHAAIVSLARLGDDLGYRELTRMSYSPSAAIRKEAFALMEHSSVLTKHSTLIDDLKATADKLAADGATRGDLKILSRALKEFRYAFKVFAPYRRHRKVTVFGSARTAVDHPTYIQSVEFGRRMAEREWMVVTGAGGGIMEGAHVGAGRKMAMGLNILLPFEQEANRIIHRDKKLVNLKYFFTRKLLFVKEVHAIALFPGGFGTQDEGFETLTLVQTGKRDLMPIVCVEEPGGTYWTAWLDFVREQLLENGLISPDDLSLLKITDDVDEAVDEIMGFYTIYNSMRYVRGRLVLRLHREPNDSYVERLNDEFADVVESGRIEKTEVHRLESDDEHLADLPRLAFHFNRKSIGRLRQMIDMINDDLVDDAHVEAEE
eukprot:g26505.t1